MTLGDDELNFTEDEARGWAGDPNNQARDENRLAQTLIVCLLLVVAVLILVWLASSLAVEDRAVLEPVLRSRPIVQ